MDNPTAATRFTWRSAPLADGQEYRFCIHIATAPYPSGVETSNSDHHAAEADSSVPSPPTLTASLI